MNSYELSRTWFNFCFDNPELIKPTHTAIYFMAIEHCNRLGWKEKFGFPSQMVMEAIGVKNWRTYSKALNELVEFGFIKMVEVSKNQYSSNIIALVINTKAPTKALDKALSKHLQKQGTKQGQSTVSIDKQETRNKEQLNKKQEGVTFPFINFWNLYNMKVGLKTAKARWAKLKDEDKSKIMVHVPLYLKSTNPTYWKHPTTYLNGEHWTDDITTASNGIPSEPDLNWIATKGKDIQLYQKACKIWRENGFENVRTEGSTIYKWNKIKE